MFTKQFITFTLGASLLLFFSCESISDGTLTSDEETFGDKFDKALDEGGKLIDGLKEKVDAIEINGFSIEDDKKMGKELYNEIILVC